MSPSKQNAPVPLLSSPRRRRRLAWLAGALVVIAAVLAVVALVPSHGGPVKGVRVPPRIPLPGATTTRLPIYAQQETPAEAKARKRAEAVVRPLAVAFVDDLLHRRHLARAYALLSPDLQKAASLHDWQQGRFIPLSVTGTDASTVIAFSGGSTVGTVASMGNDVLFAVRFDKVRGRWLIDYLHEGRSSTYVDAMNFAPAGFLPGSRHETLWTWLALIGGFLALVAVAALVEAWLRDSRA